MDFGHNLLEIKRRLYLVPMQRIGTRSESTVLRSLSFPCAAWECILDAPHPVHLLFVIH